MNSQVKLALYIAAVLGTLIFGGLFARAWRSASSATEKPRAATTNSVVDGSTNEVAQTEVTPAEVTPEGEEVPLRNTSEVATVGFARVFLWGFLGVASLVGLGALLAHDFSQYAANRTAEALFDDEGEDVRESTYEQVEKAYSAGDYLGAIGLLRDCLKENPKGVHAQIRIAEIYEKDLNNPVAAALEYEEVLRIPFDSERKGWTAIHLVNLYNRLGKHDQAVALMQRIIVEFPDTPAAAKARERLDAAGIEPPQEPSQDSPPPAEEGPPSHLPPGFRPKGT